VTARRSEATQGVWFPVFGAGLFAVIGFLAFSSFVAILLMASVGVIAGFTVRRLLHQPRAGAPTASQRWWSLTGPIMSSLPRLPRVPGTHVAVDRTTVSDAPATFFAPHLDPQIAQRSIIQVLTAQGAQITHTNETLVTGVMQKRLRPDWRVAFLLGLLCVVPAVYYIVTRNHTDTTTFMINIDEVDGGIRITSTSRGDGASAVREALATISE